jgi:hypothetical protein
MILSQKQIQLSHASVLDINPQSQTNCLGEDQMMKDNVKDK